MDAEQPAVSPALAAKGALADAAMRDAPPLPKPVCGVPITLVRGDERRMKHSARRRKAASNTISALKMCCQYIHMCGMVEISSV